MTHKRTHIAAAQSLFALAVAVVSLIVTTSCSDKKAPETQPEGPNVDVEGTVTLDDGRITMTWVQDNRNVHKMPIERFTVAVDASSGANNYPDELLSSMSAFLVPTDSMTILFDTGLGGDGAMLVTRLIMLGVSPDDVTHVFLTHLHPDHIGGMMDGDRAVFENAAVLCSETEYHYWMSLPDDKAAQQKHTMAAYESRLQLFSFGDVLPGGVIAVNAVGHTPGHTAFRIGDFLVVGDIIHGEEIQLSDPTICATFDMDSAKAVQSRTTLIDYARDNGLIMAGMHLADKGFIAFD